MSNDEAEALEERLRARDSKHTRQEFLHRMERKLNRKERDAARR